MMANIRIDGMAELLRKLDRLDRLDAIKPAIKAAAAHVKGKVAIYPPATEANNPGNMRWYQRGFGPKWRRKDGSIGSRKSSETLGRKWTTGTANNGLTGIVGNNVSYGPYVQDEERQTGFHADHGWKTTETVAEEETDTVVKFIRAAVEKELAKK